MNGSPNYAINDCVKQLDYTIDAQRGGTVVTEMWIGPTDAIEDLALTWYAGKEFTGDGRIADTKLSGYIQSSVASKMESERSKWTVSTTTEGRSGNDSGDDTGDEQDTIWTINTGEYTESLLRFLSPRQATAFEIWKNSKPVEGNRWAFVDKGIPYDLSTLLAIGDNTPYAGGPDRNEDTANLIKCAKLYSAGVDSWKAYFIQATRTKYGLTRFPKRGEATIGTKDDTPTSIVGWSDVDWLYTGYQVQEVNKRNFTLTETWNGIWTDLGGWSDYLYDKSTNMEVYNPDD